MNNNRGTLFALLSIAIPILCIVSVFIVLSNLPEDDESEGLEVIYNILSVVVFSMLCIGTVLSIIGLYMESKKTKTIESNTLFLIGFFMNIILILLMFLYRVH
jgi:hypothetical protein